MTSDKKRPSPYQGLIPYDEHDAPFFFGREREAQMIIANLYASSLTLLYGESGVGKSSVLRAGVMRRLREAEDQLVILFDDWKGDPLSGLKDAAAQAVMAVEGGELVLASIPPDAPLSGFLRECSVGLRRRLLIILDQFEEYFLYHVREDDFASAFPKLVTQASAPLVPVAPRRAYSAAGELAEETGAEGEAPFHAPFGFLISMREDSLAKLDIFEGRIPTLFDNYLRIEPLDLSSGRDAIVEPIKKYNELYAARGEVFSIEDGLVDAVLEQVKAGQVILGDAGQGVVRGAEEQIETPYLQLVMTRLWDEERKVSSTRLRLRTLDKLGNAKRIVREHLDSVMDALPAEQQNAAARIFRYLVTPGGTKIAYTIPDLAALEDIPAEQVVPLMLALAGREKRILSGAPPPPDQPNEPRYEIAHDALAPAILDWRGRYVEAQQKKEAEARQEQQLREAEARQAQELREAQAEADRLLREAQVEADKKLERERNERLRERTRRLYVGLAVTSLLLFLSAGFAVFAFQQKDKATRAIDELKRVNEELNKQRQKAVDERGIAEEQRELAVAKQKEADEQRGIAEQQKGIAEQKAEEARKAKELEEAARLDAQTQAQRANEIAGVERNTRLGMSELWNGHTAAARDLFIQSNKDYATLGDHSGQAFTLANIAETYAQSAGIPPVGQLKKIVNLESNDVDFIGADTGISSVQSNISKITKEVVDKLDEQELKKLIDDRKRAIVSYGDALKFSKNLREPPDRKLEALMNERLGDVYLWSLKKTEGGEALADLEMGLAYYEKAAKGYYNAEAYVESAQVLKGAGDWVMFTLLPEGGRPAPGEGEVELLERAIRFYGEAVKVYSQHRPEFTLDEAAIHRQVGRYYETLESEDSRKKAITAYRETLDRLKSLSARRLPAESSVASKIADLYVGTNNEEAASYRVQALKAHLLATASGQKPGDIDGVARNLIAGVGAVLSKSEQDMQTADRYFKEIVGLRDSPVYKATVLRIIGDQYWFYDRNRAVGYYEQEAEAWRDANDLYQQASTLFMAGQQVHAYGGDSMVRQTVSLLDRALDVYRQFSRQKPTADGIGPKALSGEVSQAGVTYEQTGNAEKAVLAYGLGLDVAHTPPTDTGSAETFTFALGRLHLKLGDVSAADEVFRRMIRDMEKTNPGRMPDIYLAIGDVYAESGYDQGDVYAESGKYDQQALEYYDKARVDIQRSQYTETSKVWEKVIKLHVDRESRAPMPLNLSQEKQEAEQRNRTRKGRENAEQYITLKSEEFRRAGDRLGEASAQEALGIFHEQEAIDWLYQQQAVGKSPEQETARRLYEQNKNAAYAKAIPRYEQARLAFAGKDAGGEARVSAALLQACNSYEGEGVDVRVKQLCDAVNRPPAAN